MADNEWHRMKRSSSESRGSEDSSDNLDWNTTYSGTSDDIPDAPAEDEPQAIPRRSGIRVAEKDRLKGTRELTPRRDRAKRDSSRSRKNPENREPSGSDNAKTNPHPGPRRKKRRNYRLMLCAALLAAAILDVLFLSLFLNQHEQARELKKQVDDLTKEKTTLTNQLSVLSQETANLERGIISTLPDPTTALTDTLPDLIPQLTDGIYVIHAGEGYDYIKVPDGYLSDKLNTFRDAQGYNATNGSAPTCPYLVLYPDRVIGLSEGDTGFVSTDRTATGAASSLPAGFTDFVASFFA